jgi:membrane protein DedA with SNARE-associated domain
VRYYLGTFGLLACAGVGIPANEDIIILGAGAMTLSGKMSPVPLVVVILLGLLVADSLIYFWGRKLGVSLLLRKPFSYAISPAKLEAAQKRFEGGGAGLIFATRFLAGLRAPVHFAAGTLKISYRTFVLCDIGAALIEVPALVYAARYVGGNVDALLPYIKKAELVLVGAFLVWLALRIKRYWLTSPRSSAAA